MAQIYDKIGLRFQFPENWSLDESEATEETPSVSVFSPSGAFWSVICHQASLDPERLVAAASDAMQDEYDELDIEEFAEQIDGHDTVGATINFYCLDLTNTATLRSLRTPDASYLILCQADDREFELVAPVFEAMTRSMLGSLPVPSSL